MNDPFLIDECLSPDLVALANERGHHATHVVYRSAQGTKDRHLVPIILEQNFVFVTNNGKDFLKLLANQELHPGLVVIVPGNISAATQVQLFGKALDIIERESDLTNRVVEVFGDGLVTIREWPTP